MTTFNPTGTATGYFFFTVAGVSEDSSMYILHFPAPCNRNAGCLPLKGLINQLLGECWRAISIVSRLRSLAFQLVMATSLDETYPLRRTLQIVQRDVATHYGDVRATNFNIVPTSTSTDIGQLLIINIGWSIGHTHQSSVIFHIVCWRGPSAERWVRDGRIRYWYICIKIDIGIINWSITT